ncbi:MAG: diadenylate cyclase CdaA [Candidatus Omnitrophica bacterium]|nr:diadenylate cyclase CdaA [Candidatus Omnitrophota bacterium]
MSDIFLWKPVIEILILWFMIYHIMLFFEGTRAIQVLRGIVILLVAFFVFQNLGFTILDWLLTKLFAISVIAILIIFHPEIRHGLARLGQRHLFGTVLREEELDFILSQIVKASEILCKNKIGALIAVEREDSLAPYMESGVVMDAKVSIELIQTIFAPSSILHDGGLIIQHGRMMAGGCLFPLTASSDLSRVFGTRHRAALGLSEETDALVIVVSEERQDMSFAYQGRLHQDVTPEEMLMKIKDIIKVKKEK